MILLLSLALARAEPASAPDPVQALAAGEVNVDHYYNLGLALEAQEDLGRAALAYRRGLLLAPNDAEVQERLAMLQALPEEGPLIGPKLSGWLAVLALAGACLMLTAWRLRGQRALAFLALPLAAVGMGLVAMTQRSLSQWGTQGLVLERAVVTSQAGGGGQPLFELAGLETVEILATAEQGLQIQTQDGRVGWMSEQQLGVLDPRAEPPALR